MTTNQEGQGMQPGEVDAQTAPGGPPLPGDHWSSCAVHNAPALPVGPCDCGAVVAAQPVPVGEGRGKRPWWRLPLCWAKLCGHRSASDETGCWGECNTCGHRAGFVDRATLRAYADREVIRERIRRGEMVSLADGLAAIGAGPEHIVSVWIPPDAAQRSEIDR